MRCPAAWKIGFGEWVAGLWLGWELSNEWVPDLAWWKIAPRLAVLLGGLHNTILSSGELSVWLMSEPHLWNCALAGRGCSPGTGNFPSSLDGLTFRWGWKLKLDAFATSHYFVAQQQIQKQHEILCPFGSESVWCVRVYMCVCVWHARALT